MLRGHAGSATLNRVAVWAAEEQTPARAVAIAIFRDATKIAHVTSELSDLRLVCPFGRRFPIIPEPSSMVVLQENYRLTPIALDDEKGVAGPDTRQWLRMLGKDLARVPVASDDVPHLAQAMIYNRTVIRQRPICHWLGNGDTNLALRLLAANDVDVTNTGHCADWLQGSWGIQSQSRLTQSKPFISPETLHTQNMAHIKPITYAKICRCTSVSKLYHSTLKMPRSRGQPDLGRTTPTPSPDELHV